MSTYASSLSWARHVQPYSGGDRVAVRNKIIIPFSSHGMSTYARALAKFDSIITQAVSSDRAGQNGPAASKSAAAVSASEPGARAESSNGGDNASGSGGGDGDSDDGGDGDGDGPRRKVTRRKSSTTSAARRGPPSPNRTSSERAHKAALIAFTVVTALLLATVLAFGLNGQPTLAEKVLSAFVSVATVAAAFLRPK